MDMIVAKFTEEGEKKTTHMTNNYTSPLGGLAGGSTDTHGHLDQDPAPILQHTSASVGSVQRKSQAGDNSSILSYTKDILRSLFRLNFFIAPTSLLRDSRASIMTEPQPPLWQSPPALKTLRRASPSAVPSSPARLGKQVSVSACVRLENIPNPE